MDLCHLINSELDKKFQKYKGRVVPRGDVAKDDSGQFAGFTEQGSSASLWQCKACRAVRLTIQTRTMVICWSWRWRKMVRKLKLVRQAHGQCNWTAENTGSQAGSGPLQFRTLFFLAFRASGFHFSLKSSYKMAGEARDWSAKHEISSPFDHKCPLVWNLSQRDRLDDTQTPTAPQRQTTRGKTCCFVTHIPDRNFDLPQLNLKMGQGVPKT